MSPHPGVRIFAKLEGQNPTGSLKDRIAKYMLEEAEAAGRLRPEHIILEPTSGNTGISLAMIGRSKGYRVHVVMPENVTQERRQLLEIYGAEIITSDGRRGTLGSIEVAQEMVAKDDCYFMPYQYGSTANPRAHYETTAKEILDDLPEVDAFVAGLGTGGTLMGVGPRLKERSSEVRIVAVAPHPEEIIQGLRSLEDGFIPPILDLDILSSRLMIRSRESFEMTRELMEKEGLFTGISSGAVMAGAVRGAQGMDQGNIVALLADGGWKYLSTQLWTRDLSQLAGEMGTKIWW
jgi:cysteine synthase B